MKLPVIKPTIIALLTTLRCTAACENCCFGCTPKQGRSMTYQEMKDYVDMCLEAYPDSLYKLSLTGGECMLLGKDIDRILSYGKSKGLKCILISNAFWAADYDKAYSTLKRLKRNGLDYISFSSGADHNKYVPWTNVRNAAIAAALLGIDCEVRLEYTPWSSEAKIDINSDTELTELSKQGKIAISHSPWMRFENNRKKEKSFKYKLHKTKEKEPCQNLFRCIVINPYGEVYACCGIGCCHIPQLRLGNVNKESVKTVYERAFDDFLKIWLYTDGPQAVLEFVDKKTNQKLPWHTMHICDKCRTIFTDKSIIPLLKDNFFEVQLLPLLSYKILAKQANEQNTKR